MKGPRHYSEEGQILKAIDRTNRNIKVRRRLSVIWWNRYQVMMKDFDGVWGRTRLSTCRDNSEHYARLADQIEATTLRKLKNKLAEFRTVPIPGVGQAEIRVA